MSIEYPATFGEAFWGPQVDAQKLYADDVEKALDPFVKSMLALVSGLEGMPQFVFDLLTAFNTPGNFGLNEVGGIVVGNTASGMMQGGISPYLTQLQYSVNAARPIKKIELDNAASLLFRGLILLPDFNNVALANGYDELTAQHIYRSLQPYPDVLDIISWQRFQDPLNDVFTRVRQFADIDGRDVDMWRYLATVQPTLNDVVQSYVRNDITEQDASNFLQRLGYNTSFVPQFLKLGFSMPDASILLQSSLFRGEPFDIQENYVRMAGIHPDYAPHYIDGVLTKPDVTTIVRYLLRTEPELSSLEKELKRIGIHPDYIPMFRTLAYPVPPVQDLITMAVREAFSPAIAGRFGQYEDYPTDLTRFAEQQGISEEWARRYWAAHWSLPSPQQGFEMLHRGVITEADLNLLLRALDIMPFWRDKLLQISFNPLTRVDVRRMYSLGVINESEVTKAYRDIGYTAENADRLREFTVRQSIASQSGLSVAKIITAYKNGYTNRTDAYNAISRLGVRPQNISEILESADLQLAWKRTQDRIAAIKNLYKKDRIKEDQARGELASAGLDSNKIQLLILQWQNEIEDAHGTLLSKTDVLALIKKNLITKTRALQELDLLGYTTERANLLLASIG